MTEESPAAAAAPTGERRRRRSRKTRALARIWSEWRIELLVLGLAAAGVFLLLERMNIRATLVSWLVSGWQTVDQLGNELARRLTDWRGAFTLSNVVGSVLLLAALLAALARVRWRLMTRPGLSSRLCPRCGSGIHRVHRRAPDRLLSLLVPVRRYGCRSAECSWQGLRTGRTPLD